MSQFLWRLAVLAGLAVLTLASPAAAWTRPGHMVTAAIAYDDLKARSPRTIDALAAILAQHPDRGAFEVAAGRAEGEERALRLILEAVRWPDDARGGPFDHPTWHYALRPLGRPHAEPRGEAREAFALNARLLQDPDASSAERAIALCWVMHLAGDVHQPLHNAERISPAHPDGDHGGGLDQVIDPATGKAISLHWFWDDSVNRLGDPEPAMARARALEAALPRGGFPELARPATAAEFGAWAEESYALAGALAYPADLRLATSPSAAIAPPQAYAAAVQAVAERRAVLAGHRLADVLEALLAKP